MPKISVILPTYKHRDSVGDAIHSVLNQTYRDFELIIIDDCSVDGTDKILEKYAVEDSRIRLYRNQQNSGCPALICNRAIRDYAIGEYIAFQFDDDIWFNWCLEYLIKGIDGFDFVFGQSVYIDYSTKKLLKTLGETKVDQQNILTGNKFANNAVLIKKSVFLKEGGFDENALLRRVCDWELWIRIFLHNYKVNQIPNVVSLCYLFKPESISDTIAYDVKAVLKYIYTKLGIQQDVPNN